MSITYVRKYRDDLYKVVNLRNPPPSFRRKPKPSALSHVNETKLRNSLSRSRSRVYELAICNDWQYFVTFTFDQRKVRNRYDLVSTVSSLRKWINNFNRSSRLPVKYLLIPERHHDGAWHVHGLIMGLSRTDIVTNANGYPTWLPAANKFGFVSLDPVRDSRACAAYLVKYITKDLSRSVAELGAHVYYASHRLRRSAVVCLPSPTIIRKPDFSNEYCRVLWLNDPRALIELADCPDPRSVFDGCTKIFNHKLEVYQNEL